MLHAYYNTGGIGQPLQGAQEQFRSASPDAYWKQIDRLEGEVELGCVLHSVRAATREHLEEVRAEALQRMQQQAQSVGANAVVIKDVPANSIAVGIPARIIPRETEVPSAPEPEEPPEMHTEITRPFRTSLPKAS